MPLSPIKLRPGINRNSTNYANEGGYYACDKVRFRAGKPEKIGGWVKYTGASFLGACRSLFNWVTLDKTNIVAVATNTKYYLESGGVLYDITPVRYTDGLPANAFNATGGSTTLVVTHPGHTAANGDFVNYTGVTPFAGIAQDALNAEFQVTYVDSSTYTIELNVPAAYTETGGGEGAVAAYQMHTAPNVSMPGRGFGAGSWGRGAWNTVASAVTYTVMRLWSQESFGQDHVFCPRDGTLYYFAYNNVLNTRAVAVSSLPGAANVPLMATKLLMSTQDRHLIAFGVNPVGDLEQDPLLIRWADKESVTMWTNLITNTAGELRCSKGNYIVTAVPFKNEILVFTDSAIHSMKYVGAPYTFGINPLNENISIVSPSCVSTVSDACYWMGNDKFYIYNGRLDTLPCSLGDHVFNDINRIQATQIFSGTNEGYNEIWWFYCSANSADIDRYVIYNYVEKVWSYGTMHRTAWLDTSLKKYPLAAANGYLYRHEEGTDDDRVTPIHAWIETSDFNLETGEHFMFVKRILPDVSFEGSNANDPHLDITLTPRNAPGGRHRDNPASRVARSAVVPVEQYTEQCDVRLRGRQIRMRIESTGLGTHWKLGIPRIELQPDGKK